MEVRVNVYDIGGKVNKWVGWLGLGAYHSGVQVGSREYTFSNSGVVFHTPFEAGAEAVFKESILIGEVESMSAVNAAVAELRRTFAPGTYDLTRQNCNHFTEALCQKLVGKSIPGYINRSARLGSSFAPKDTKPGETTSSDKDSKGKNEGKSDKKEKKEKTDSNEDTERPALSDAQKKMLERLKTRS